jgi:hypothetical protein
MKRRQFIEWEDFAWFPEAIRDGETDYLRYMIEKFNIYKVAFPLIKEILDETGDKEIIDLCSGGWGACIKMAEAINNPSQGKYRITLSDKYPNISSCEYIKNKSNGAIGYIEQSIDVLAVPKNIKGMRTIFSAFHHFPPVKAKQILEDAVSNNRAIAIFEGGERSIIDIIGVILTTPFAFFIFTPFIKPYKLTRFIFTYLLPLIPLTTIWDGIVSMLRMYHPSELLEMAKSVEPEKYVWRTGRIPHGVSKVIYLTGYPLNCEESRSNRDEEAIP